MGLSSSHSEVVVHPLHHFGMQGARFWLASLSTHLELTPNLLVDLRKAFEISAVVVSRVKGGKAVYQGTTCL